MHFTKNEPTPTAWTQARVCGNMYFQILVPAGDLFNKTFQWVMDTFLVIFLTAYKPNIS